MGYLKIVSTLVGILACLALATQAAPLSCRTPAAPACILNSTSQLFTARCATEITENDAYRPRSGRTCKWVGYKRVCSPYTATTGNCKYVVDSSCHILKNTARAASGLCKTAKCSWPGNPKTCKRRSCRFLGGSCKITFDASGTSCYDAAVIQGNPCLKGLCNGKGSCIIAGRDGKDCSSPGDSSNCVQRTCRNDTCVSHRAPVGTICGGQSTEPNVPCDTPCCYKYDTCNAAGVCDSNLRQYPPAGTPCVQTPTTCVKGACDGRGACLDTTQKAPAGWPCNDPRLKISDDQCARTRCNATGQCVVVNYQDGSSCNPWNFVPDFRLLTPEDSVPPPPPGVPPPPPFVPPNETKSCAFFCYKGNCISPPLKDDSCFPCHSGTIGCPEDPTGRCSCYRGSCLHACCNDC